MMMISVVVFMARRLLQRRSAVHTHSTEPTMRPLKLRARTPRVESERVAGRPGGEALVKRPAGFKGGGVRGVSC